MKPNDQEMWTGLSKGPFPRKNFTERLRRRIQHKLDSERQIRQKSFGLKAVILAAAALVLLTLRFDWEGAQTALTVDSQTGANAHMASGAAGRQNHKIRSVWLLGLRADATPETQLDTYRTLMIGEENNRLQVTGQGEGVLAPFGQKFWKIDLVNIKKVEGFSRYVNASPADQKSSAPAAVPYAQNGHVEKILFVGNRYLSVSAEDRTAANREPVQRIWTREFGRAPADANEPPHVRIQDVLSAPLEGDQWAVSRGKGRWTAETTDASGRRTALTVLTLPKEVVVHDDLVCSWGEVTAVLPDALDAVSSPDGDMVAVFTKSEISVYAYAGKLEGKPKLIVPLKPGESMIMSQWANQNYAADWIAAGKRLLK